MVDMVPFFVVLAARGTRHGARTFPASASIRAMAATNDAAPRPDQPASAYGRDWVEAHLADERRKASLLGEIREAIFGAQDGLVSTLAVVSTVAGASANRVPVLVAGIATALAGVFSMAAGEYMSSKSQREIFAAQITGEREEVLERPGEAEAEMAFMLEEDGLPRPVASTIATTLASHPEVLLKTMVEKELGLAGEHAEGSPFQGALVMGTSFGLGSLVPVLAYLVLPIGVATWAAVVASAAVLFGIGVLKSRWTRRSWLRSGVEILILGAVAGIAGFLFGNVLPSVLGASVRPV